MPSGAAPDGAAPLSYEAQTLRGDPHAGDPAGRGIVTGSIHAAETLRLRVGSDEHSVRLDKGLARLLHDRSPALSRTRLQQLIQEGCVEVDGLTVRDPGSKLAGGADVVLSLPPPVDATPAAEDIPLDVLFEDSYLLVLDKPAGLVVHPANGHDSGTLVNALLAHCGDSLSGIGGVRRPGIVHRLDKDTTGLMVVAKTDAAHQGLAAIFADHGRSGSLVREYLALVWGVPGLRSGTVDLPLGRHPHQREKIAVQRPGHGRHAVTHWAVEERFGDAVSLLRCRLETGRTHQIRVHLAEIGHPLLGDPVYGAGFRTKALRLDESARTKVDTLGRQALHAAVLGFDHPLSGETLRFERSLPTDLRDLADALRG